MFKTRGIVCQVKEIPGFGGYIVSHKGGGGKGSRPDGPE